MTANKTYTVTDGEMVLTLEPAEEGGYLVTCPFDPELNGFSRLRANPAIQARSASEGRPPKPANFLQRALACASGLYCRIVQSHLVTEAESLDEAFVNARDAADALNESHFRLHH